jgi:hypothetical protein
VARKEIGLHLDLPELGRTTRKTVRYELALGKMEGDVKEGRG